MKKIFYLGLLGGAVFLAGCKPTGPTSTSEVVTQENSGQDSETTDITSPTKEAASNQRYLEYSSDNLVQATANGGRALLFFHASWCPTCRAAEAEILEDPAALPEDVTILKVDYDTASDLKQQYGVVSQHTFVQVDATGEALTKWNGGSVAVINEKIQAS